MVAALIQRFAAFLAPLTIGRVSIATSTVYISKVSLVIFLLVDEYCIFWLSGCGVAGH